MAKFHENHEQKCSFYVANSGTKLKNNAKMAYFGFRIQLKRLIFFGNNKSRYTSENYTFGKKKTSHEGNSWKICVSILIIIVNKKMQLYRREWQKKY